MGTLLENTENQSYLADLIGTITEKWRPAFEQFVETGEAEAAFLDYLNEDKGAQDAVETAFNRQAEKFENLAAELRRNEPASPAIESKLAAPARVAAAVQAALDAPSQQRVEVLKASTAEIAASMPAEERIILKEFAESLKKSLTKAGSAHIS